jgi:hypothetical protein
VAFRPPQVHAQEHLGPVGRLGAAGTRADREERRALVVLAGEEEGGPFTREVGLERGEVALELGFEFGVGGFVEEFDGGEEVVRTGEQLAPRGDFAAESVGLAQDLLRTTAVIPEPGFLGQCLDLCNAGVLGVEVKDAPRSTGSVQPVPGWRMLPPSSGPGDPGAGSGAAR